MAELNPNHPPEKILTQLFRAMATMATTATTARWRDGDGDGARRARHREHSTAAKRPGTERVLHRFSDRVATGRRRPRGDDAARRARRRDSTVWRASSAMARVEPRRARHREHSMAATRTRTEHVLHRFSDRAATGRRCPRGDVAASSSASTRFVRSALDRPTDHSLRKQSVESGLSPEYPVFGQWILTRSDHEE